MIGQLLTGRYLILKQLGEGGFSKTYLAIDKYLLNQPACVVKYLKPPLNSSLSVEKAQQLFETEARSVERLGAGCSRIPTLLAYCHEQNNSYLVEEYVRGENLEVKFNRGGYLSTEESIHLLKEVLQILDYVHQNRVIHCDVKPSNLVERENHDIALIDFGAAYEIDQLSQQPKQNHPLAIGTFGYMPDEQKQGHPQINSDLYALGVSVIQLITGVLPQQFQPDPASGELNWHDYLPNWGIDPRLVSILDQMTRRDYRVRYQTAAEVAIALEALSIAERHSRRHRHRARQTQSPNLAIGAKLGKLGIILSIMTMGGGLYFLLSQNFFRSRQAEATSMQNILQIQTAIFKQF
jgi:serine/threonine protein kinase